MRTSHCLAIALLLLHTTTANAQLAKPANPLWEPIVDKVYLQEIPTLVPTDHPLTAITLHQGRIFVGHAKGVSHLAGESLTQLHGIDAAVTRLFSHKETLLAAGPSGLWRTTGALWVKISEKPVADLCVHNGRVVFASGNKLYAIGVKGFEDLMPDDEKDKDKPKNDGPPILGVASYSGTLYVHEGKRVGLLQRQRIDYVQVADFGHLERGCTIRDILSVGSRLLVATNKGLEVLRGMTWYHIRGEDGLCYEDTTTLANGFDRDVWIGTARGAIRNIGDQYQFFGKNRWIPHDHVNAIATSDKAVYIATDGGLGIIRYEPYTLAKKAAYYERALNEWGMKRLGFTHQVQFENGKWVREVSDNDVGFSSHYLHAKCFEYAVTKNEASRAEAVDMMKTVKWSEEITGILGFPARSIYAVDEPTHKAMHGSGGLPAEWHPTPDGQWEWKGDTSSDETDAHVYETTIFLSLVANKEERVWAIDHLRRVVGHIVDNGFVLRDFDGKPTRWGRWDPAYLQTPYGALARGLNGMEAINYLTTAHHFTGEEKFAKAKAEYLKQGYLRDIIRQKTVFPPAYFVTFDDRLAFYSYFPLIQFETDADLKALWLRSLERSWEIKRSEAVPWFNFIYGALTGNDCESDRAVDHLRGWPLDIRRWQYTNSHRDDLQMPKGYRTFAERPKPLNPRETEPNRWDGDFMRLDGGSAEGTVVTDPSVWLDAYWMARYYGLITAPQTDDETLLSVAKRNVHLGAEVYAGPARPKLSFEK